MSDKRVADRSASVSIAKKIRFDDDGDVAEVAEVVPEFTVAAPIPRINEPAAVHRHQLDAEQRSELQRKRKEQWLQRQGLPISEENASSISKVSMTPPAAMTVHPERQNREDQILAESRAAVAEAEAAKVAKRLPTPKMPVEIRKAMQKQRRIMSKAKLEEELLNLSANPNPSIESNDSAPTSIETVAQKTADENDTENAKQTLVPPPSKATNKKARSKKGGNELDHEPDLKAKQAAMDYLDLFINNRKQWKFQKVRQIWILRNLYYQAMVTEKQFKDALSYMKDMGARAKEETIVEANTILEQVRKAKEAIKTQDGKTGDDNDKDSEMEDGDEKDLDKKKVLNVAATETMYKRAKKVIKKMQEK
ncbi:hypothetical protein BDV3_004309 [Batrachochytrium dendrobatidis]|uniref:WKF domain-containing protein n=1 Tax=Batrachochytrium dendrobatidis (strain JEL423) TaxID=403673 RepID=A0A177WGK8_BATDL|nr:hypothetical protein BDEG_22764 [Batrachochytrium dendrobatidis JEL423]